MVGVRVPKAKRRRVERGEMKSEGKVDGRLVKVDLQEFVDLEL